MDEKTQIIRCSAPTEQKPHNPPIYLTSSFTFTSAKEAADIFSDTIKGNSYSRFTNPNVDLFQKQLAILEGGEKAIAFSSGMASLNAFFFSQLKIGNHIIAAQDLFGSTIGLISGLLARFGIESTFVPVNDISAWEKAIQKNTVLMLAESPSNPTLKLLDIEAWVKLAKKNNINTLFDNCMLGPVLQKPFDYGVDAIMHSATKSIDGQGRVLGGAIVGSNELIQSLFQYLRTTGSCMSPFNAWILSKSLETLDLRMQKHSKNALKIAKFLKNHPKVKKVIYPGLKNHPQYDLAKKQMQKGFGSIISFIPQNKRGETSQELAWKLIDNSGWFSITGNFGDTKSTIIHPATTTHHRMGAAARKNAGIDESLIRFSVGLETQNDIIKQLNSALLAV